MPSYEPYEPPRGEAEPDGGAGGDRAPRSSRRWPVLRSTPLEDPASAPAPRSRRSWQPPNHARTTASHHGLAWAGVVAAAALTAGVVAAGAADGPTREDRREEWEQCLAQEQAEMAGDGGGGFLEPEDLCSIQYPDAEEEFGDLGYDNPDPFDVDDYFQDDPYDYPGGP